MRISAITFILLFTGAGLISCRSDYSPKPTSYPRIHFPVSEEVTTYDPTDCPYQFSMPSYYRVERKEKFFDDDVTSNCWANIICDSLNGTIYISYKPLEDSMSLMGLMEDAYKLTYKHTNKADYIQPQEIDNGAGAVGLIYYVGGDAASNIQFFVTDTNHHFARGALYFYTHPNADSLKPVVQFVVDDIEQMLASWRWK